MEDKLVKKLPAFDHIKVLQDGNFGCTLCVEEKIYNGIFTPKWECVEKLHLVEVDAYKDYDYTLKDGLNPMLDKEKIDIDYDTDEELAKGLILKKRKKKRKKTHWHYSYPNMETQMVI